MTAPNQAPFFIQACFALAQDWNVSRGFLIEKLKAREEPCHCGQKGCAGVKMVFGYGMHVVNGNAVELVHEPSRIAVPSFVGPNVKVP